MIAVCVASHDRPLRLRWLLGALAAQAGGFEVVVAHDSAGPETDALLAAHPLRPRVLRFAPGSAGPAAKRNAAWRACSAPLVAFTDDDCRPAPGWVAALAAAAARAPGAVLQGTTRPDPDEAHLAALHGVRSQHVDPPTPWGQTCNIAYPRAALEAVGGFDERLPVASGEDTDLLQRVLTRGVPLIAVREALVWHAVEVLPLLQRLRRVQRWRHLAGVVRRHPRLRRSLPLGVFWTARHAHLVALGAAALTRRRVPVALAAAAYARAAAPSYGPHLRGRGRALAEVPLCAVEDAAEVLALARGSLEARTLLL